MSAHPIPDAPMGWYDWLAMATFYGAVGAMFWAIAIRSAWPAIAAAIVCGLVLVLGHFVREGE